jgi:RNA polymerase sigma factor (sigma-70 family)
MEPLVIASAAASALAPPPPRAEAVPLPVIAKPDQPSLTAVFEAEESGLLRYAIGLVRRRDIAEELVQETFLRLHQVWGEVENPRAWLYRSLRNLSLNHIRDRPNESELHEEATPHDASLPVEQLGRSEAVGMVRLLLAELPPEDRDLIHLKYHDDLKYHEISRRTGLTSGNVGYRLHHLLKSLADRLKSAGVEGSQG